MCEFRTVGKKILMQVWVFVIGLKSNDLCGDEQSRFLET